jgi:ferrochelatase
VICFQSRLGREPWIPPYTEEVLRELPRQGIRRAVLLSPSFVADCLETLEELHLRAVALFRQSGGEELAVVPSLNADERWVETVVRIARESGAWLRPPAPR